jgi:hypothetical protein
MPSEHRGDHEQREKRREWLERRTTDELLAALDPLAPTQKGIYVGGGGRTLIRQILTERGVLNGS